MTSLASLPAEAVAAGLSLRRFRPSDRKFMDALFLSVRGPEVEAGMPLATPAQRRAFLLEQAALQFRYYASRYDHSGFAILCRGRQPVGRLFLAPDGDALRVVDISLLPAWRGRGLGGALLRAVVDQAAGQGKAVTLSVDVMNPAQRLYARLGFVEVATEGLYRQLRRAPGGPIMAS